MNNRDKQYKRNNKMSSPIPRICKPLQDLYRPLCARLLCTRAAEVTYAANALPSSRPFTDIPGPSGVYNVPFIGPAFHFKPFTKHTPDTVHEVFESWRDKYGDIVKFNTGREMSVLLFHPDQAKEILSVSDRHPYRQELHLLIAYYNRTKREPGLGVLQGEEWESLRKPAQYQMLRPVSVSNYIPMINHVTNDFVSMLSKETEIEDCLSRMFDYTTESIGMLCFNRRLGCLDGSSEIKVKEALQTFFKLLPESGRVLKLYRFFRTPIYNAFEKAADTVYGIADTEVDRTKAYLQSLEPDKRTEVLESTPHLLYRLLGDPRLTQEQVRVMMLDLFTGGVDSTSNSLTILLHQLSVNQDKQEKLHQEIVENIGKGEITKEALNNMSYLKACVRESMRKTFPVHIGLNRIFKEDITLNGFNIPQGTQIIAVFQSMAKDKRFFDRPEKFMPERFLRDKNEDDKKIIPYTFLPFGFGPRSCIGQRFAENEIYIAIAKIIQNFRVRVPPGSEELPITYRLFATPARKVTLKLEKRT